MRNLPESSSPRYVCFLHAAGIVAAALGAILSAIGFLLSAWFQLGWGFVALYAFATVGLFYLAKWRLKRFKAGANWQV